MRGLSWHDTTSLLKEIIEFAEKIEISEICHIKLKLKKAKVQYYLRKIRESNITLQKARLLIKVL